MTAKTQPETVPEGVEATPTAAWEAAFLSFNPKGWEEGDRLGRAVEAAILADRASNRDQPEEPGVEIAPFLKMAACTDHTDIRDGEIVMRLQNPETREWVVLTRDDFRRLTKPSSDRIRQETAEERIREGESK